MTFEPLTADRRRQQTRDYLLQAAAQVFAERGFHAATLDEVAAAAGFTKGAVYSNFKNKEDLFLALLESTYSREMSELKETIEGSDVPPNYRLGDFVGLIDSDARQLPENWGTLYLEFCLYALRNPTARDRLNELERADIGAVAGIIESAQTEPHTLSTESARMSARLITALFRGISMMRALDPDLPSEPLLEAALHFVASALGADPLPEAN